MAISFNSIPGDLRTPLFYAEVNAGASLYQPDNRLLLMGAKLDTGLSEVNVPTRVGSRPAEQFGSGSELTEMCLWALKQAPLLEVWAVPVAISTPVAATATITVSGAPIATGGVMTLYVCGSRIDIGVTTSDTDATIATSIAAAVNTGYYFSTTRHLFPVSASAAGAVVTLTARTGGAPGNTLSVDLDLQDDESSLGFELLTLTSFSGGAGLPVLAPALAALGDDPFDTICVSASDAASLKTVTDFVADRWGYASQIYGHAVSAAYGTLNSLGTLGGAHNEAELTIAGSVPLASPVWRFAAAYASVMANQLGGDNRARPLQTLALSGIIAKAAPGNAFSRAERESLLKNGISTVTVDRTGTVRIERAITTWQENESGLSDQTWLNANSRYMTAYVVRFLRDWLVDRFARVALASDTSPLRPGTARPKDVRDEALLAYGRLVDLGVVEDTDTFATMLVVERAADDPNRVNVLFPPDLVNQLIVLATNVTVYQQYS